MSIVIILAATASVEGQIPDAAASAFSNMQNDAALVCSFTRSYDDGESSTVERFDSTQKVWQLLKIDGVEPDADALEEFAENKDDRADRTFPTMLELDDLGIPESYKPIEETAERIVYEFAPAPEDEEDEKFIDALLGNLTIDTVTQSVVSVEVNNTRTFSPAMGVKVKNMHQRIEYRWLEAEEIFVIGEVTVNMAGKAFGLKKISQDVNVRYDDFSCAS